MKRTPDQIMADFDRLPLTTLRRADVQALLWDVLEDVLDSVNLACQTYDRAECGDYSTVDDIYYVVKDYVTNHYGENS